MVRTGDVGQGVGIGGHRGGRGKPGYPVPPMMKGKTKGIPHLDELSLDEQIVWLEGLISGQISLSEKIDGSCRINFGLDEQGLWVSGKNISEKKRRSRDWPASPRYDSMREAHVWLEDVSKEIPDTFRGNSFGGDVLVGPMPNVIRYAKEGIVLHTGKMCRELAEALGSFSFSRVSYRPSIDPESLLAKVSESSQRIVEISLSRNSSGLKQLVGELIAAISQIPSALGGDEIEGIVLARPDGSLTKLVDRGRFTERNRKFWEFRDRLGNGRKMGESWKPGIGAELKYGLAREALGYPGLLSPSLELPSGNLGEFVESLRDRATVKESALRLISLAQENLSRLREEWDSRRKEFPAEIAGRNDSAFCEERQRLFSLESRVLRMEDARPLLVAEVLGQTRMRRLFRPDLDGMIGEAVEDDVAAKALQDRGKVRLIVRNPKVIKALARRGIVVNPGSELGYGSYGIAYEISYQGKRRVLKLTNDPSEAKASNLIKGKTPKHVAHVIDVFQIMHTGVYGIVQELLHKLDDEEADDFDYFSNMLQQFKMGDLIINADWEGMLERYKKYGKDGEGLKLFKALGLSFDFPAIVKELKSLGIEYLDLSSENLMKRGNDYVVIDLGGDSRSQGKEPEIVEAVLGYLREGTISDKVGVTIGRFQPFTEAHGKLIRQLTSQFNKVIVLIAGNRKDERNPFDYDLRLEIISKSLPDVFSKLEVHKAEIDGKPSGFIPGILTSLVQSEDTVLKKDTALTVLIGPDREADVKRMFDRAQASEEYGPGPAIVQTLPEVQEDGQRVSGTAVREALQNGERETVEKMMDPHLVSNKDDFNEVYEKMRSAMGLKEGIQEDLDDGIEEDLEAIGSDDGVERVIRNNASRLLKKGIKVDQLKKLGNGVEGVAFDMGEGKVLKVTADVHEAITSNLLKQKGQGMPNIVKIYDVFRFIDTGTSDPVYGIIEEKLTPLSGKEEEEFDQLAAIFTAKEVLEVAWRGSFDQLVQALRAQIKKRVIYKRRMTRQGAKTRPMPNRYAAVANNYDPRHEIRQDLNQTVALMRHYQIDKIFQQLRKLNIHFADFHSGNLMMRGTTYVINDLGRSHSNGQQPPVLEEVMVDVLSELGVAGSSFSGPGSTQTGVRGGSSGWSAPYSVSDDEEDQKLWQRDLTNLRPIDRRKPEDVPKSLR